MLQMMPHPMKEIKARLLHRHARALNKITRQRVMYPLSTLPMRVTDTEPVKEDKFATFMIT
jgi:hypothetical protein